MNAITQQTWDQLVTEGLAIVGAVLTIGNQAGWWIVGNDTIQSVIQLLTMLAAFAATILYGVTSTPNRVMDAIIDAEVATAYHHGYDKAMAREDKGGI